MAKKTEKTKKSFQDADARRCVVCTEAIPAEAEHPICEDCLGYINHPAGAQVALIECDRVGEQASRTGHIYFVPLDVATHWFGERPPTHVIQIAATMGRVVGDLLELRHYTSTLEEKLAELKQPVRVLQ